MVQDMFFEVSPFIVRDSETKELVGVFWADNRQALFDTVDEFVDPKFCEFRNIGKSGGIRFEQMEEETMLPTMKSYFSEMAEVELFDDPDDWVPIYEKDSVTA